MPIDHAALVAFAKSFGLFYLVAWARQRWWGIALDDDPGAGREGRLRGGGEGGMSWGAHGVRSRSCLGRVTSPIPYAEKAALCRTFGPRSAGLRSTATAPGGGLAIRTGGPSEGKGPTVSACRRSFS